MWSSKWHGPEDIRQTLIREHALEFMGGQNLCRYKHFQPQTSSTVLKTKIFKGTVHTKIIIMSVLTVMLSSFSVKHKLKIFKDFYADFFIWYSLEQSMEACFCHSIKQILIIKKVILTFSSHSFFFLQLSLFLTIQCFFCLFIILSLYVAIHVFFF